MINTARSLLQGWLLRQLDPARGAWLGEQIGLLETDAAQASLDIAFGLIPRRLGSAPLTLGDADSAAANEAIEGWEPQGWSVADAARILLLSGLPQRPILFAQRFRALCSAADLTELTALYRGLPLYPDPAALLDQVGEGLRSNMRGVFDAIVHHNPFPRIHFDEHRWNHMVLKALFVGSPLAPVQGLDQRANPELARMLCDFAHERQAAGRPVPFEIWRCVGPFAQGSMVDDLARAVRSSSTAEQRAAALALAASPDARARKTLADAPTLRDAIARGELSWATLG
ncbi:MAG: EboA domain-containing protein [Rhizobacter sp.]|nr:EboA domain-containing protein [Rhizobacter sp.]